MRKLLACFLVLVPFACQSIAPEDPWNPGPLTLLDPDARVALAARLESEPWPEGEGKPRAVRLLSDWVRRWGIRTPLPFFQRLAPELPPALQRELWHHALDTYPGQRPYPPREDPTAARLLKDLAALDSSDGSRHHALLSQMHAIIDRLGPLGDPRFTLRSSVAELLADFPPGPEVTDLFAHLLEPGTPGAVRARAMLSLGIAGFSDPRLLPELFSGLHSVQDRINLAPFALTALSGARGAARELVGRVISWTLEQGRVPVAGETTGVLADLPLALGEILAAWEHSAAALQDPSLILRTFARVLVTLGEEASVRRLLLNRYALAGRAPDFMPDEAFHAVREALLNGIPRSRAIIAEEAAGITAGQELASRAIAVSRVSRTCQPDLLRLLQTQRHTAVVRLTTMDWIAQFRDAALKAALAKPGVAPELTRLWNLQETEEGQWRQTAHLWMPLVQVPGEGKVACDEADSFGGMSPDEWLRARIAKTLWTCSVPPDSTPIPPGEAAAVAGASQGSAAVKLADWELAWSAEKERARAARAAACLASRLKSLEDWESRLDDCKDFDCLWSRFAKEAGDWPEEALEKAQRLMSERLDATTAARLPTLLSSAPPGLAASLLEWFEPLLSRGVRIALRDTLRHETCLQDSACLPILLYAVALANRPEVKSEAVLSQ